MTFPASSQVSSHQVTVGNITYKPQITYWGGVRYRVIRMDADPSLGAGFAQDTFAVGRVYTLNRIAYETLKQFGKAPQHLPAMIANIQNLEQQGRLVQDQNHTSSWVCAILSFLGRFFCESGWYYHRAKALQQALADESKGTVATRGAPKGSTAPDLIKQEPSLPKDRPAAASELVSTADPSTNPQTRGIIAPISSRDVWIQSWNRDIPPMLEQAARSLTQHHSADQAVIWQPGGTRGTSYKLYCEPGNPPKICIQSDKLSDRKGTFRKGTLEMWCEGSSVKFRYPDHTGAIKSGTLVDIYYENESVSLLMCFVEWVKTLPAT